jgi:beta-mannanase
MVLSSFFCLLHRHLSYLNGGFRSPSGSAIWTWSPHVGYLYWDTYYPGSQYVDWVATGVLNFGSIGQWSQWWSFQDIFGSKYPLLTSFGKPLMVAEFGSLAVGGNRAAWYQAALTDLPTKYPATAIKP